MARRSANPFSITALAFAVAHCPDLAGAQSTVPAGGPGGVERRLPSLLVSVAASPVGLDDWRRSDGPAFVGSVQGRLKRFLVLEGEVTRWTGVDDFGFPGYFGGGESSYYFQHRHREVWTVGSNLLLRAGTSRVIGFAGAGLGVRSSREAHSSSFRCPPGPRTPSTCTGEEVSTSDHWTQYPASLNSSWSAANALRTSDVVREPTRVPDSTRAQGKDVRITLNDGTTHRGKLAAITGSVVTIDGRTIPLADVLKIEKVGHATRNALVIGMLAFVPTVLVLGPAADMGTGTASAIAAAGVGSGIGVGALIDAVRKPGNVVYVAPGSSASFAVKPILMKDRKGVTFVTNW